MFTSWLTPLKGLVASYRKTFSTACMLVTEIHVALMIWYLKNLCFIIACRKCNRSDMSGGFSVVDKGDNGRNLSKDYKPKVDSMIEKLVNLDWKVFAALDCSMWRKYRGERHLHSHSNPWVGKDIVFYHHDTNWISSFCASRSMHMIRADLTWMLRTAPSMRARRSCSAYCGNI